jgi:hypothetical protein
MNAFGPLTADPVEMERFVRALFRHANTDTTVSLRAFYDDRNQVFRIQPVQFDDPAALVRIAAALATDCAQADAAVVFCPPIATFARGGRATERDLVNGLALSVECDAAPEAARARLESLIGPATLIVRSGGTWTDPVTGEAEDKLHLHWRLTEPTRDAEDHARLKRARALATRLVGGDATNQPAVHPMRWPGSWHRKGSPRLARIVAETEAEIELGDALEMLEEAAARGGPDDGAAGTCAGSAEPRRPSGEERETAELVSKVLTGAEYHAPLVALSMRYLKGGMADAQAVMTLRGIMRAVPEEWRDRKDGKALPGRWQARYDGIPRAVSTARAKLGETGRGEGAEALPTFRIVTAAELFRTTFPPREKILAPWLPEKGLAMVYGVRGVGKTHLTLGAAYAIASGGTFLRWKAPKPRRVVLLDGEMPAVVLQERLAAIVAQAEGEPPGEDFLRVLPLDLQERDLDLSNEAHQRELEEALGDAEVVFADNISTLVRGGRENEAESWLPVQQWALRQRRAGRSIVFIHHAGKGGQQRGTSRREDVLDTVMALRKPGDHEPDQGARFEVHFEKSRGFYGDDAKPFEGTLTPSGTWAMRELADVDLARVAALTADGLSVRDIAEETGITKSRVSRLQKQARARGMMDGAGRA